MVFSYSSIRLCRLAGVVLTGALVAGCRIPTDSKASGTRGANDPGASSFAFFGGLKAFFVDDAPGPTRPVSDDDLQAETAPVSTTAPAGIR